MKPLKLTGGSSHLILSFLLHLFFLVITVCGDEDPEDEQLLKHYVNLHNYYTSKSNEIKSDCKMDNSEDDDMQHHHWGTKTSLAFLSEKLVETGGELLRGEKRINRAKLRKYLARVGYLKKPGSFLFLDKQSATMRLLGCKDDSVWRTQGEKNEDMNFQSKHHVGSQLKTSAPNAYNYLHKYICFSVSHKCSHTFYVVSKPLPEMPLGMQVSEGGESEEWAFTCTFPFCRIKPCAIPGTKDTVFPQRSYFPYTIKWDVPKNLRKELKLKDSEFIDNSPKFLGKNLSIAKIEIKWEEIMRNEREAPYDQEKSYTNVTPMAYVDGFGDPFGNAEQRHHPMHTRIVVKKAEIDLHSGTYECIIWDSNGVATTPSKMFPTYKGKANINVMPGWQLWLPGAAAGGCILLTALIILICPRKMEYDDGKPYTKAELEPPAELNKQEDSNNN